ncbi:MAG: DUF1298 domain-containing protein [Frankia sp.]|nr:DUF1298 domain-containing protein [Frankia sp.]
MAASVCSGAVSGNCWVSRTNRAGSRPLSSMDLALLRYQKANGSSPVVIGSLLRVAGDCDSGELAAAIDERARLFPELRERLVCPASPSAHPVWAPDPAFDVTAHVREHILSPGSGDAGLRAFVQRQYQEPIPLDRPPWQAVLLRGHVAGECAVLLRASHVWVDGGAKHRVLEMLFGDADPTAGTAADWKRDGLTTRRAVTTALLNSLSWAVPSSRLHALDRPVSGRVSLAWATTSTDRLRALGRAYRATVNDVFLVALSEALDAWTVPAGRRHAPCALMPMSSRRAEERHLLSNFMVGARVRLPCGLRTPWERFAAIGRQTPRFRSGPRSGAGERWLFERLPPAARARAVTMGVSPRKAALSTSNLGSVRGPLAVAGRPVVEQVAVPVLFPGQRMFVVLSTLAPATTMSLAADRNVPDAPLLADLWGAALERLERAAGLPTDWPTPVPRLVG